MIKLNRTTEYGLMALRHMSRKLAQHPQEVTSAREIATCYGLPFEITAKTLQRLKDTGLIHSAHGARGGYTLQRPLTQVSLGEFLELMEGRQTVVACASLAPPASELAPLNPDQKESHLGNECEYGSRCEIKHFLNDLNSRILGFLAGIPLAEIAEGQILASNSSLDSSSTDKLAPSIASSIALNHLAPSASAESANVFTQKEDVS